MCVRVKICMCVLSVFIYCMCVHADWLLACVSVICVYAHDYVCVCGCVCWLSKKWHIRPVWNVSPSNHQIRNAVCECAACVSAASGAVFGDWVMWYSIFQWIYGHPELALIMETGEIWPYLAQTACWTKLFTISSSRFISWILLFSLHLHILLHVCNRRM